MNEFIHLGRLTLGLGLVLDPFRRSTFGTRTFSFAGPDQQPGIHYVLMGSSCWLRTI